jgi:hypothetical protein
VEGFPFQTSGKIVSSVTIARLADGPSQQLLVTCFDGFFYVIDGITSCAGASPACCLVLQVFCSAASCALAL